ncbi:Hypothetical protein A7982_05515 [Minicystis rosea]|nr:Hypothetical protein A7982_05515 [Minicystis rosea]
MRNGLARVAITVMLLLLLPASAGAYNLLGSSRGGSSRWDFCYGKPDATPLPPDPRTLVQPGVNAGKAVYFNAFWKDCHVDPVAVQEEGAAQTCGELRARFYHGGALLETGGPEVGTLFTGNDLSAPASLFGVASTFTAAQYNSLWQVWGGFLLRPDNFDELVGERYGSGFGPSPNPYPLPWENPNLTNGGSGKLPEMFTQLRNPDGSWSGRIGITCHACHSGAVGSPSTIGPGVTYGGGSSLADLHLLLNDMLPLGYPASLAVLANLTRTRGTNNASDINLAFLFPDQGILSPDVTLGVLTSGSTASMDTPAWWNMGHRPVKFVDGVFPMDAPRVDMVFYTPFLGLFGSLGGPLSEAGQDWMRAHGPALNTWAESLKAPAYPLAINTSLAEQGAVLFHTLDLWGAGRNNPVPRPQGNGSCASCHGAYSPQYVNNPAFLDTPALEGMASYIVPLDIIGTDPVRVLTNNEAVQVAGATNFFGYPTTAGTDQDCGPQNRSDLRGDRELGYLAPPLYGVWATAPYFHNGSVPNVWEVLKPSARKPLWKRVSKPARWDQKGRVIMGFDTDITRAYDAQKMGWKYDTVACQWEGYLNPMVSPYINCNPDNDEDPLMQDILAAVYSNFVLTWNVLFPPTLTQQQKEDRKIYNAHMYGQGNEGHELSAVLTDNERYALIEYLKTL